VANNLDTAVGVVSIKTEQDLVVGEHPFLLLDGDALGGPGLLDLVVVLVGADGDGVVDVVADGLELLLQEGVLLGGGVDERLLLFLEVGLFLEEVVGVFLSLNTLCE
jgi:hypothetical protein